jgi:hypothetical protein
MKSIAINRFHARYRLAAGAQTHQERLQRILAEVLDGGLEAAVQRSGIDPAAEVCIRKIYALVTLDLGQSDSALATKLTLAIAEGIDFGLGQEGVDLVRYGSRAHAVIDFAVGALSGDFSRFWAWRRLGFCDVESVTSSAEAVRLIVRALTAEPRHATVTIAQLAANQTLFERLLQNASQAQLLALGQAAVEAIGVHADVLLAAAEEFALPIQVDPARRLIERSMIARATVASGRIKLATESQSRALAALAICECEPVLLRAPLESARTLIHAVAQALVDFGDSVVPILRPLSDQRTVIRGGRLPPASASGPESTHAAIGTDQDATTLTAHVPSKGPAHAQPVVPTKLRKDATTLRPHRHSKSSAHVQPVVPTKSRECTSPAHPPSLGDRKGQREAQLAPDQHLPPEVRRTARTRFGGLLYLIHLAGRMELAERILQDRRLSERSPRWCLHQLAMALVAVPASDPAALAFAGLLPDSEPPCQHQPPPVDAETAAIGELHREFLRALHELLDRPCDPKRTLLDFVCRRPAEITADPGWLEVRFSLDDVRTEIRAAGLDRDPGWVPWLGMVIRFVYA